MFDDTRKNQSFQTEYLLWQMAWSLDVGHNLPKRDTNVKIGFNFELIRQEVYFFEKSYDCWWYGFSKAIRKTKI